MKWLLLVLAFSPAFAYADKGDPSGSSAPASAKMPAASSSKAGTKPAPLADSKHVLRIDLKK